MLVCFYLFDIGALVVPVEDSERLESVCVLLSGVESRIEALAALGLQILEMLIIVEHHVQFGTISASFLFKLTVYNWSFKLKLIK